MRVAMRGRSAAISAAAQQGRSRTPWRPVPREPRSADVAEGPWLSRQPEGTCRHDRHVPTHASRPRRGVPGLDPARVPRRPEVPCFAQPLHEREGSPRAPGRSAATGRPSPAAAAPGHPLPQPAAREGRVQPHGQPGRRQLRGHARLGRRLRADPDECSGAGSNIPASTICCKAGCRVPGTTGMSQLARTRPTRPPWMGPATAMASACALQSP